MLHRYLLIFFLILFFKISYSQPYVDLVNVKYQYYPKVSYKDDSGNVRISQYTYGTSLPIQLRSGNVVLAGGIFDQYRFKAGGLNGKRDLYSFSLHLGYLHNWKGNKWKALLLAIPRISSNQILLSGNTFQQGGVILVSHKRKQNLSFKFGLYYNKEFFGHFFIPLVGLEWSPVSKIHVFGILPTNMNLEYKLNRKMYAGISFLDITTSFRINKTDFYVRNGDKFWGHVQVRLFYNYYAKKNLVFFAEGGYAFFRVFQMYNSSHMKERDIFYREALNSPVVSAGIAYRIRLDAK